ncbi:MAG: hypothetical protein IJY99_02330 [Alphaproteobacteria bacterium]|nr:hypothetical protein [Alphaproteobacteria bacterium]
MANNFDTASKKIQDLMTLYAQLDNLPSRSRWHFEPKYDMYNTCAFIFAHQTSDASKRYEVLNELARVLHNAGIKNTIQAREGTMADVVVDPGHAELARKMFARYQTNKPDVSKVNNALLEQEWLRQRQK